MHKKILQIKKLEGKPFIYKKFLNKKEIKTLRRLYLKLPIEINNLRQKIKKKKWIVSYNKNLQIKLLESLNYESN